MHKTNIVNITSIGNQDFNSTLGELREFLDFDLNTYNEMPEVSELKKSKVILIHEDLLKNNLSINFFNNINVPLIIAKRKETKLDKYNNIDHIIIPSTINEVNRSILECITKFKFYNNSSIKIKEYTLNKNEKKIEKEKKFIILTEKEISLLELLLKNSLPLTKKNILEKVWKYSPDADSHTVETHIYRLRKKVKNKFLDENFILNNKDGYFL
jgi:hypothetical protein|tara:strand:+ start:129 stop:767 length:639 start_codon:yes stop_codon:yes gene_type:complete